MQLFTHCEDVEAVNAQRLAELSGDSVRFAAQDTGRTEALHACQVTPHLPVQFMCLAMHTHTSSVLGQEAFQPIKSRTWVALRAEMLSES